MSKLLFIFVVLCGIGVASSTQHKLAVYWGQDSAGSLRLTLETKILNYCQNYDYDIIPVAFLNVFFDINNKNDYPGINLANHCNKTFKGYPSLLNCTDIGSQITQCQKLGKKVLISLGGAAGLYYFSSSTQAVTFANTIWKLFLDGSSGVRPFHNAVLDGVDLDIEGGTTSFYGDFVKAIRKLMATDNNRKYYITGAPQCPYPDARMGPGSSSMVLTSVPQEFDYLFVQFYNNYCSLDNTKQFNLSIYSWFKFVEETRSVHGKGPLIFIGLPADARASRGYQTPSVVETAYNSVKDNANFGGVMLWDASFDENNVIGGQHYSALLKAFMNSAYDRRNGGHIVVCRIYDGVTVRISLAQLLVILGITIALTTTLIFVVCMVKRRSKDVKCQKDKKYLALQFT